MIERMSEEGASAKHRVCAKCGNEPAGPGDVLGESCGTELSARLAEYWATGAGVDLVPYGAENGRG